MPDGRTSDTSAGALRALALGVVAVLIALIAAEVVARLTLPPPDDASAGGRIADEFVWRAPAPYVVFRAKPNVDVEITDKQWVRIRRDAGEGETGHVVTDEHGFRYKGDLNERKQAGELRIFLLGGSVAINGLTNETTICGYLERRAQTALGSNRPVRCVTAGIQTAVSDQELAMLTHYVADHEPDIVVSLSGFNDVIARNQLDPRLGYPATWMRIEPAMLKEIDSVDRMLANFDRVSTARLLIARSRLATWLVPGLRIENAITSEAVHFEIESHPRPDNAEIVDHLMATWSRMRGFSESIGARFFAVLQPAAPAARETPYIAAFYDATNRAIESRQAPARSFTSFDRLLDDDPGLFYDPVHTVDAGNARIADALFELISSSGALEP